MVKSRIEDRSMPAKAKKKASSGGARLPAGKKQMLVIMDQDIIRDIKVAAAEDEIKLSHAVEEAVREWLENRRGRKGGKQ
jgi:hypothetical protein